MIKKISLILLSCGLLISIWNVAAIANVPPDYEKYGRIAIAVVKEDYPGQDVTDYKYMGREKLSETDVTDSFHFQVKEKNTPLTVVVKIGHSLKNKKLLNLTVEEKK